MIDKIDLKLSDIKEECKKHLVDLDHFWYEINNRFNLNRSKNAGGREKRNGIPVKVLFQIVLCLPFFTANSVSSFFKGTFQKMLICGSTSFYRFLQDSCFNWRNSVYELNSQIELKCKDNINNEKKHYTALIADDTTISKCGKKIEGVSRVFDHVTRKYVIGYKLLGLCWFNGYYSRFLDFSFVSEKKISFKRNKPQFKKNRDKKSSVALRKKELEKDKITLACEMFSRAVKNGFIPDFYLCDTWFTCAEVINHTRIQSDGKTHLLGMIKNGRRKYVYNGMKFTLSELRKHLMKKKKRCNKYRSNYIAVECFLPDVGKVKLFFSRFAGNRKWIALITTRLDINYIEAIKAYSIRWNIEIGFKEMKQLLGLGRSQANDFGAQIAHTSSVILAHALMAYSKYHENHQSMGILFEAVKNQYLELMTMDKILLLIEYILVTISEHLGGIKVITLDELLNSTMYNDFKNMVSNSTTLNVGFSNNRNIIYYQQNRKIAG